MPIARVECDGLPTQLFCQIPDLDALLHLEQTTGRLTHAYVPVLGWAADALEQWEAQRGEVAPAPWSAVTGGLAVPVPVYQLEESGLVIVQEPGSVKAALAWGGVTHMPGLFLSDPVGVEVGETALFG